MSWDSCDFEPTEFYHETFPKARKQYRCCECTAPILVGEKHLYARAKSDDHFWTERQHMLCRQLCMQINADDGCCAFGMMKETWGESDYHIRRDRERNREVRTLYAGILRRERASRDTESEEKRG